MKTSKKTLIIALVCLVLLLMGLAVICLNSMFPKAPPISCPNPVNSSDKEKNIFSIHLSHNGGELVPVKNDEIGLVTQHIPDAEPTRRWSVNEVPVVADYYTIEIAATSRTYLYHIYREDAQVFLEDPYVGVYTVDEQLLELVASYFE